MVTLLHDMMHKEVKVYVNDMIAKSKSKEDHITDLKKLFKRFRKSQLQLSNTKCTFSVRWRKLLGFVVGQNEIEIDPK